MEITYSNNPCSAFVREIVIAFEKFYPSGFLGRTAVQKLAYFSKVLGVPIPCSFEIYHYGPFSDEVSFAVDALLADDVILDQSQLQRYSVYKPGAASASFPPSFESQVGPQRATIENVVQGLGGYKPEQLELIATLHFIASRQKAITGKRPNRQIVLDEFSKIKGQKFDAKEVGTWFDSLRGADLV